MDNKRNEDLFRAVNTHSIKYTTVNYKQLGST